MERYRRIPREIPWYRRETFSDKIFDLIVKAWPYIRVGIISSCINLVVQSLITQPLAPRWLIAAAIGVCVGLQSDWRNRETF